MYKLGNKGQKIAALAATIVLSGCLAPDMATRSPFNFLGGNADGADQVTPSVMSAEMEDGSQSEIINGLLNRQSVLRDGPFARVATSVMGANSRAAEADLRAARLRAEAQSMNWLPTLGPSVSLSSLGAVVAGLFVEQVIYDNGRRRAERDFAKADIEVAAVALARDSNDRVMQALDLYLTAEAHRARAEVNQAAMERMEHFEYVMQERVKGGVSNRADLMVVQQKLNQMRADLAADTEAAVAAMDELSTMSSEPLAGLTGLSTVPAPSPTATPLAVLKSQAEANRSIAAAKAARAGFLPGLTASGTITGEGNDIGLRLAAPNGFGFGTGASLAAIEAEEAGAAARTGQVREDVNRSLSGLNSQLASLTRRQSEARLLADQAAQNYEIFAAQLKEGTRSVPEVVGVFETKIRTEREAVVIQYDIARIELKIAAIMGALVDGERI